LTWSFSRPAKPIIDAVGIVFWQGVQIATNALLSLAEKVLGICIPDKRATSASFSTNARSRALRAILVIPPDKDCQIGCRIGPAAACARSLSPA
jgi:hypothetical protein